jgi:hypothetical protein
MTRRWVAGMTIAIAGLNFRIRAGYKREGDLALEWETPTGWRAVPMAAGFLIADFLYENEDELYQPPAEGGRYYLRHVEMACEIGWEAVQEKLRAEQLARRTRDVA